MRLYIHQTKPLAITRTDRTTLVLWDITTTTPKVQATRKLGAQFTDIPTQVIVNDTHILLVWTDDAPLKSATIHLQLIDIKTLKAGEQITINEGHDAWLMGCALSPDSRWAFISAIDEACFIIDLQAGKLALRPEPEAAGTSGLNFDSKSQFATIVHGDQGGGSIHIVERIGETWQMKHERVNVSEIISENGALYDAYGYTAFSPDSKYLYVYPISTVYRDLNEPNEGVLYWMGDILCIDVERGKLKWYTEVDTRFLSDTKRYRKQATDIFHHPTKDCLFFGFYEGYVLYLNTITGDIIHRQKTPYTGYVEPLAPQYSHNRLWTVTDDGQPQYIADIEIS